MFIGTKRGIEHKVLGKMGYELCEIDVEGIKGRGLKALLKGFYQIPQSMWQSRRILKTFSPEWFWVSAAMLQDRHACRLPYGNTDGNCRAKCRCRNHQPNFGKVCE